MGSGKKNTIIMHILFELKVEWPYLFDFQNLKNRNISLKLK